MRISLTRRTHPRQPPLNWSRTASRTRDIPGNTFCRSVNSAYEQVVHWKRNLYLLRYGKVGKAFLGELAKLLNSYASQSAYECIALKASFLMQVLLLQKPTKTSKAKDHVQCLEKRL